MNNQILRAKFEERLNKLASLDYGNLEPWQEAEVLNKAQDQWTARQLEGINQEKSGAESSIRRIDDLQYILTTFTPTGTQGDLFWQSTSFPADYLEWCRISANAQDDCKECPPRRLTIFIGDESDVDIYLADSYRQPDYNWATTFATIINSSFRIWTNGQFNVVDPQVTYYRQPRRIVFAGSTDPYTGSVAPADITCEFPDRIAELIIDEAASIISGDIDDYQKKNALSSSVEHNT